MTQSIQMRSQRPVVIAFFCAASLAVVPAASAGPVEKGAVRGAGVGAIAAGVSGGIP